MGLDSVPPPTSLLHLFTLQSTGDSLKCERKQMTHHYYALFIPAAAEGGLGYGNGRSISYIPHSLFILYHSASF